MDLVELLYDAARDNSALTPAAKQTMEEGLRDKGHQTTWDAIRWVVLSYRTCLKPILCAPDNPTHPSGPCGEISYRVSVISQSL